MKYFSKTTNGFYDTEINAQLPSDAVAITDQVYEQLLSDQTSGKAIGSDVNGNPISNAPAVNLASVLAQHRYSTLVGGYTVGNVPFETDQESRADLLGAFVAANANPNFSTIWKGADGNFYPLTATQIVAAGEAVLGFVAKCYAVEDAIRTNIATYTTAAQVIAAFTAGMAS